MLLAISLRDRELIYVNFLIPLDKKFTPKISKSNRTKLLKGWQQAIRKTLV